MIKISSILKKNLLELKVPDILYHGRKVQSKKFSLKYVGKKEAYDAEGPGFYFSNDYDDAHSYTNGNGIVIKVRHTLRNLISKSPLKSPDYNNAIKLIKMAPGLKDALINWGYDPPYVSIESAFNSMVETLINKDDTKDTFLSIWYDLYHSAGKDAQYIEDMIKLGYDGIIVKPGPAIHVIVYNIKKIKIQK